MATTRPRLAPGEVPVGADGLALLLPALGDDMVLVGGQALAFWMDRYGLAPPSDSITTDADALGDKQAARHLAARLHARVEFPPQRSLTAIVAQIRWPRPGGVEANIDVLHQLFSTGGLRKSTEFTKQAKLHSVAIELDNGVRFHVLDPFDVLDSRIQNAAGLLDDKGLHVLTQAHWAVELTSRVLLKLANDGASDDTSSSRLGNAISRVFKLAHSSAGRRVWNDYGIDVLDAIDTDALIALAPGHTKQLRKVQDAQAARNP